VPVLAACVGADVDPGAADSPAGDGVLVGPAGAGAVDFSAGDTVAVPVGPGTADFDAAETLALLSQPVSATGATTTTSRPPTR
jgi:hypothetical protein